MNTTKSLFNVLTTPGRLANALDWRKMNGSTLLSLNIHADRICLARCDHPSSGSINGNSSKQFKDIPLCRPLESLPLNVKSKTIISEESKQRLANLIKDHKVCGFVVSWPLQQDTGRMGASCGRTLFTLEQLMEDTKANLIFSPNRPLCLWDSNHVQPTKVDCFGRSPEYAKTCSKTLHLASQEQYHQDETITSAQLWQDFCQQYWPEQEEEQPMADTAIQSSSSSCKTDEVEDLPSLVTSRKLALSHTSGSWRSSKNRQRNALVVTAA
jgi:hypothetical protein